MIEHVLVSVTEVLFDALTVYLGGRPVIESRPIPPCRDERNDVPAFYRSVGSR